MGKASRKKHAPNSGAEIATGVLWAAQIVRDDRVLETFSALDRFTGMTKSYDAAVGIAALVQAAGLPDMANSISQMPFGGPSVAKTLRGVTVEEWADGMEKAFKNRKFAEFVRKAISVGHQTLWASGDPAKALQFGDNGPSPPGDPIRTAIVQAHRRLAASPDDPGWITLSLFCLGRMVAVNASDGYKSDEWTEATFLILDLEKAFLLGDGPQFAKGIVKAERALFDATLADVIRAARSCVSANR